MSSTFFPTLSSGFPGFLHFKGMNFAIDAAILLNRFCIHRLFSVHPETVTV